MLRKTIRFMDSAVNRIVAILCLLLFLICLYAMIDAVNVYLNANDKSVLKYKPQLGHGSEVLGELSDDAVAWLTIDNTSIDYPVMQGRNNEEYINKDPFGEFSLSGSIFLDRIVGTFPTLTRYSTVIIWSMEPCSALWMTLTNRSILISTAPVR